MTSAHWLWLAAVGALAYVLYRYWTRDRRHAAQALAKPFPEAWREVLRRRVSFYRDLPTDAARLDFEQRVQLFLARTRVTGIETEVDDQTRALVGASAVIPAWGLGPGWHYATLREVLIVPDAWQQKGDKNHEFAPLSGTLLGSVQNFQNDQYMRLSKASLDRGFRDWQNGENVGLHEFAHLLDEADGQIDGMPTLSLPPARRAEWQALVRAELKRVRSGHGILNPYAGTNEAELFAVAAETFFEDPDRLARHHPELYELMTEVLGQHPNRRFPHLDGGRPQRRAGGAPPGSGRG